MTLDSPHEEDAEIQVEIEEEAEGQEQQTQTVNNTLSEQEHLFFVDTVGDKPPSTGLPTPQPRLRSTSPTPSNSSDEVIVFQGRNRRGGGIKLCTTRRMLGFASRTSLFPAWHRCETYLK